MMRLRPDVAGAEQRVVPESAFYREHVFLRVRNFVVRGIAGNSADGFKLRPVDARIRMARRGVQRSQLDGKILPLILTVGRSYEGSREQRRRGTRISGPVRRVRAQNSDGQR